MIYWQTNVGKWFLKVYISNTASGRKPPKYKKLKATSKNLINCKEVLIIYKVNSQEIMKD